MNRNALLIYLHDLRDLEAAKYQIEKMRKNNLAANKSATGKIQSEINAINTANYMKKPYWPDFDAIYAGFFVGGILGLFFVMLEKRPQKVLFGAFNMLFDAFDLQSDIFKRIMISVLSALIGGILVLISIVLKHLRDRRKVKEHNKRENERLKLIAPSVSAEKNKLKQEIMAKGYSKELHLKKEAQRVSALLEEAYSLNILAKPYRNLPSVYYIYEYMSTSQASLEETFMHEHMENGFQRIEKKLDIIIAQNEEIIFTTRQIEANTSRTVEQTTEMLNNLQKNLESQQRTEQNALEAAQYASICATYSKTTAFFSAANYLSKGSAW